jgi:hypothetical protein
MNGDSDSAIEAGRLAWQRIRENGRRSFDDWLAVARALAIGRSVALQEANTDKPYGSRFTDAMGRWLRQHGLDGIRKSERSRALSVLENLPAISVWRAGLDEDGRRQINHPEAIWRGWRRSRAETAAQSHVVRNVNAGGNPKLKKGVNPPAPRHGKDRAVHWPQDALRRASRAMMLSRSSDLMVLARVALEAAVRHESDLLALLEPPDPLAKKPHHREKPPRQIAAPAAQLQ